MKRLQQELQTKAVKRQQTVNSATILPERKHNSAVTKQFCESCGCALSPSYIREYPGCTICGSRRCYYRELAQSRPDYASLIARIPKKYRTAMLSDFTPAVLQDLRTSITESGSVFLCGTQGIGKTHLAAALVNSLLREFSCEKGYDIIWRRSTDLILDLQSTFGTSSGQTKTVIQGFKRIGLLILDDFGAEKISEWSMATVYAVLAERIDEMRPTIVTSNLTLDEIDKFEPRIASRLAEFTTTRLPGIDKRVENRN